MTPVSGSAHRGVLAVLIVALVLVLGACSRGEPKEKFLASDVNGVKCGRDFHLIEPG